MNTLLANKKPLALTLLLIAVLFFGVSLYLKSAQDTYVHATELKIAAQEAELQELAHSISTENVDPTVAYIITDCSLEERVAFDSDLGRLSELSHAELIEMEKLFSACGDYFSVRKAVMVVLLEREFEAYLDLVEILSISNTRAATQPYNTQKWEDLVSLEKKRSELTSKLVKLQGQIITGLKEGMKISSDTMQAMLKEGQETREALAALSLPSQNDR